MSFNMLIVDDSAVMRAMIIKTLRLTGLPLGEIYQAANGAEGLNLLSQNWIDLAFVDLNMPQMNGEEMIHHVRENPETAKLAMVVVSTEGSETRIAALKEQGIDFVHKPFTPEELRNTVIRITGVDYDQYGNSAEPGGDFDF